MAAAIFGKAQGHVNFVEIGSFKNVFTKLSDEEVDVLAASVTHTMVRDVYEVNTTNQALPSGLKYPYGQRREI